jgi:hypothetical protein
VGRPYATDKGEGMSVNEAVYIGTAGPDGRRRWCEVEIWLQWGGVAPPPKEIVQAEWQHGCEAVVCVLALRKVCGLSGILASFRWTSGGQSRMVDLEAQGYAI